MPVSAGIGARSDDDFHVMIERGQEFHQAFDRELPAVFQNQKVPESISLTSRYNRQPCPLGSGAQALVKNRKTQRHTGFFFQPQRARQMDSIETAQSVNLGEVARSAHHCRNQFDAQQILPIKV